MSENSPSHGTVLIVEDETDLADLYAHWLEDAYNVRTAHSGEEALEVIDETIDVVLLDRRMPTRSGTQVLRELRDRGCDCPVAFVTAVDPDPELASLRFNDYIIKPVDEADLTDVIETLRRRRSYSEQIERYTSLFTMKVSLDRELSERDRDASEAYTTLKTEVERARNAADDSLTQLLESGELDGLFRDIDPRDQL